MINVRLTYSAGIGPLVQRLNSIGRGKTIESAALNAYRDAGYPSGVRAEIVQQVSTDRWGVRFYFRVRPRSTVTHSTVIMDLRRI